MQRGNPEVTWMVDPVAAGRFGLTVEQVSNQLAGGWLGDVATDLRLPDRRDSGARAAARFVSLRSRASCRQTLIRTADGKLAAGVRGGARWRARTARRELLRENLRPMALVSGRLEGRDLGSAVDEIQANLDEARSCRSATPTKSAASTSRSGRRFASC